jgi:cold shock CspA family protein
MRTRFLPQVLIVSTVLFVIGCGSSNKGKLEGTMWGATSGFSFIEFTRGGKITYIVGAQKYTGTYTLGSGDSITFNLDQDMDGKKVHKVRASLAKDEDAGELLTVSFEGGQQVQFGRTQKMPATP